MQSKSNAHGCDCRSCTALQSSRHPVACRLVESQARGLWVGLFLRPVAVRASKVENDVGCERGLEPAGQDDAVY